MSAKSFAKKDGTELLREAASARQPNSSYGTVIKSAILEGGAVARYPSGRKYQHQYGNLLVTAWSERGIYYAAVLQPDTGYEVTVETPENNPQDAARYALQIFSGGVKPEMTPEWAEAAEVLADDAREALLEVDEIEIGASLGAGRQKVGCLYKCPDDYHDFSLWPRKGETATQACERALESDRGIDAYRRSFCKKIYAKYID